MPKSIQSGGHWKCYSGGKTKNKRIRFQIWIIISHIFKVNLDFYLFILLYFFFTTLPHASFPNSWCPSQKSRKSFRIHTPPPAKCYMLAAHFSNANILFSELSHAKQNNRILKQIAAYLLHSCYTYFSTVNKVKMK